MTYLRICSTVLTVCDMGGVKNSMTYFMDDPKVYMQVKNKNKFQLNKSSLCRKHLNLKRNIISETHVD